ncbi:MAG: response regulator transcription factor [Candidatus Promineifilaceae bacterium]
MPQPRILLVDDDYQLIRGLRASLINEGYDAVTAVNGLEGLQIARRFQPHIVILDINMPWMDGLEVCQRLREDADLHDVPIIFLTSRDTVDEKIAGLDAGADDYLPKPFNTRELHARIRSLLRRQTPPEESANPGDIHQLQLGPFLLDLQASWLKIHGKERIQLTPVEFELFHFLIKHLGQTFSSEQLLEDVWAYEPGTADASLVRWHVRNLRNKIETDPQNPIYLRTVPHHGYILEIPSGL